MIPLFAVMLDGTGMEFSLEVRRLTKTRTDAMITVIADGILTATIQHYTLDLLTTIERKSTDQGKGTGSTCTQETVWVL